MKAVNAKTERIFRAAISMMDARPYYPGTHTTPSHIKIGETNKTFMPLVVERIGARPSPDENLAVMPDGKTYETYSFAHYYTQNGDAMRDPEVCLLDMGPGQLIPYYYLQDGLGIENDYLEQPNPRLQADLADFCSLWAKTLMDQQPDLAAQVNKEAVPV